MFKLPDWPVALRSGPVAVATVVPGPHVPCLGEAEEFLHRILPDPLRVRKNLIRPLVVPHVDALDDLAHLVIEGRQESQQSTTRRDV